MTVPRSLVRVVIPTFNGAEHIARCLGGLLRQKYGSWFAIVGDDGSSDATMSLVERHRDERLITAET